MMAQERRHVIRRWLHPPLFHDADQARNARIIHYILLWSLGGVAFSGCALLVSGALSGQWDWGRLFIVAFSGVWLVTLYGVLHRGRLTMTSLIFVLMSWGAVTMGVVFGGIRSPAYTSYILVFIFAAILLKRYITVAVLVASVVVGTVASIAESANLYKPTPPTLITLWASHTFVFAAVSFLTMSVVSQMKDALAKTREQADLLQNVSDAIISSDMEERIRTWNRAAEEIYGWQATEAIGRRVGELLQTRYLQGDVDSAWQAIYRDGYWEGEVAQKHKNGSDVYIFAAVTLVKHANRERELVAVNRDITQTKLAEAALVASEERFYSLFNEMADIVLVIDGESGHIIQANAAVERLLGYKLSELYDQSFHRLMPESEAPIPILDRIRAYGAILETVVLRQADGGYRQMDMTATVINWGARHAVFAMLRDISERLELEQERLQIQRTREEIEREREILELKLNFIHFIVHQFRTPLAVILSSAELLDKYREQLAAERWAEHLKKIRYQTTTMNTMIEDILLFGRMMAGQLEYKPTRLALDDFCGELVDQIQSTTTAHRIRYANQSGLTHAYLDPKLLRYILDNLLSNAVKYSPEGGDVIFKLERDGEELVFTVQDQGIGIVAEDIPHLFDPFRRGANTSNIRGTGLGLAIVKDSVTAHNGVIRVWNAEPSGAVFEVRLPLLPIPTAE